MTKTIRVFAGNVRARRKELGFTQEELAEISGLSTNYIARLEIGTSTPSFAALIKLAQALKTDISDLFATERVPIAPSDTTTTVSSLLESLNDSETDYVLTQLRNSIRFIMTHRKDISGDQ